MLFHSVNIRIHAEINSAVFIREFFTVNAANSQKHDFSPDLAELRNSVFAEPQVGVVFYEKLIKALKK